MPLSILLRSVAAFIGGYGFSSAALVLLAALLPGPLARAVLTASELSFAIYTGVILWIFTTHCFWRACIWMFGVMMAMALPVLLLRGLIP